MTSPVRSFTNPACTRKRPFGQVADSKYGGNAGLFGLKHDICTVSADGNSTIAGGLSWREHRGGASAFPAAPAGTPLPPPPGMGKAACLGQHVPLLSVYFPSFSNSLRKITDISFYTSNGARS